MEKDQHITIKSLAREDRPREKMSLKGKSALSDAELIAILIGSGNKKQTAVELARHILKACDNNLNTLAKLSVKDLQKFNGIGEAKAISIVSALEIGRRRKENTASEKVTIRSSTDTYDLINGDLKDLHHEEFWIILLRRNNTMIRKEMISRGGVSGTFVDAKIIFKRALEETASGIILVHNHPSGNLKPSREDILLTKKVKDAGKTLDVKLLDHLIVAEDSFFSFADEDML